MNAIFLKYVDGCARALRWLASATPLVVRPTRRWRARQQLVRLDPGHEWQWRSTGSDPQFVLRHGLPWRGWHMLEVGIAYDRPGAMVRLYLDTGDGFCEEQSVGMAIKPGGITRRLVYVPKRLKALRFDPMGGEGCLTVWHLRIAWLTPRFAHDRLLHRLVGMHTAWRGWAKPDAMEALAEQARGRGVPWRQLALHKYNETFERRTVRRDYADWLAQRHELSEAHVQKLIQNLPRKPLISVLVPVFEPNIDWLRQCLDSVLGQYYSHWQLCIVDDASTDTRVRDVLAEYVERDARIRAVYRRKNGHICAASNSALTMADGEFVALLDHDDRLSPDALLRVAQALQHWPGAGLIYSDEDKLDADGERFDPHFKPRWNPDLLLAQNYISHLGVYRAALVREVGGFREGFEGSQDHDLALRVTARLDSEQIVHVPHVLYHWRAGEQSTASDGKAKAYAAEAGLRAVRERVPEAEVVMGPYPNTYRVCWPLPEPAPLVSLLVPTRDRVEILRPCVDAILEHTDYPNLEILILDNQSRDAKTLAYMREVRERDGRVRILEWDHPFNYSAVNNFGARHARGEVLGLLNNDVEPINADWLVEMVRQVCRPEIGCVGAKLYYPNDTVQHGGVVLGLGGVAGHSHKHFDRNAPGYFYRLHLTHNLSAVTAACLLVRKSVFQHVGGLDEEHLTVAFNDVDLCLKVREAGYRNLWTPYAELYHHESVSRGAEDNPWKRARADAEIAYMRATWGQQLDDDPAYNPNLTLAYEDFSLR